MRALPAVGRVRAAGPADLPQLAVLEEGCFRPPWGRLHLRRALTDPSMLVLVDEASGGGEPTTVGYASWRRVADEAELLRLAVLPAWRGQGVARRLLVAGEAALRAGGVIHCHLEVREDNLPARRLYESARWQPVGRRRGYYPDGSDALLYRLRL